MSEEENKNLQKGLLEGQIPVYIASAQFFEICTAVFHDNYTDTQLHTTNTVRETIPDTPTTDWQREDSEDSEDSENTENTEEYRKYGTHHYVYFPVSEHKFFKFFFCVE